MRTADRPEYELTDPLLLRHATLTELALDAVPVSQGCVESIHSGDSWTRVRLKVPRILVARSGSDPSEALRRNDPDAALCPLPGYGNAHGSPPAKPPPPLATVLLAIPVAVFNACSPATNDTTAASSSLAPT